VADFTLGPNAEAAGYRLVAFDRIGSTNNEALLTASGGDPGHIWFTALQQTAGRGRRGRQWHTPHGNLAASLLLVPDVAPEVAATLGFVAGVALSRTLSELLPYTSAKIGIDGADGLHGGRIALKWPNDVLADGAKLAGILLEAQALPGGGQAIAIGIGVNIVSAPEGLPYPTVSARELDRKLDAAIVFKSLSDHWVDAYALWNEGQGITALLNEWRQTAAGLGSEVVINTNGAVVRGVFHEIDGQGRLVVKDSDGQLTYISAGDVHFGTTASLKQTVTE
jgi:BirA family biotin operon repressor/biotin-[acetyl-CoA-carboxylase] ligase